ncbi:MAG: hypothetical protein K6F17_03795 [Lachnospiraceae bacterium]|jgi:preprotein translocase subunit SecF|nr:hypothetical protein [Lachnospiraceae bacterium]
MAKTYMIISIASFITSGIFFIISVGLFFALKINKVIDFLSGKEAKRNMERIRQEAKVKKHESVKVENIEYSKADVSTYNETVTDKLSEERETEIFEDVATTLLSDEEEQTSLLNSKMEILDEITLGCVNIDFLAR